MTPSAPLGTDAAEDRFGLGAADDRIGLSTAAGPRAGAAAERRFRFELAAHPGSVARARHLARARLSGWAVCDDTCDTAALVVSELVTNAIVHAAGERVVCELHDADDVVRIAVRDEGCAPGDPYPSPQRPEEEHGRGLLLVAAVSRAWGAQDTGPGLLVWAELERASATEAPASTDAETRPDPDRGALRDLDMGTRRDLGVGARPDPDFGARRDLDVGARPDPDLGARSDLGWTAKKPPADGRGAGPEASWGTGTAGVPPAKRIRDWGRV